MAKGARAHRTFARALTEEEKLLVSLRDEIYGGSWTRIKRDLADRLDGRPYIIKLAGRIEDDLERIKKISAYEKTNGINIAGYIEIDET